jgi:hypothetical protein
MSCSSVLYICESTKCTMKLQSGFRREDVTWGSDRDDFHSCGKLKVALYAEPVETGQEMIS